MGQKPARFTPATVLGGAVRPPVPSAALWAGEKKLSILHGSYVSYKVTNSFIFFFSSGRTLVFLSGMHSLLLEEPHLSLTSFSLLDPDIGVHRPLIVLDHHLL